MVKGFTLSRIPDIHFGPGKLKFLPDLMKSNGIATCLIITGLKSFIASEHWEHLKKELNQANISFKQQSIKKEPSPAAIDNIVNTIISDKPDCIISIGGGSVLDAGKAISSMLEENAGITEFLEGVGSRKPSGKKLPFIAIPTTAGTGSETTKNSVITKVGTKGFKRSLRHNKLVPDIAIVDPELSLSCPPNITASCGMDAFTQLIESYVSTKANVMTDGLAITGLHQSVINLNKAFTDGENIEARTGLSYASMISGITLANAGLGTVHGCASSIGGLFNIPHGIVCGTLMGEVIKANVNHMIKNDKENPALQKYARIGKMFSEYKTEKSNEIYCNLLIDKVNSMIQRFKIPGLSEFGIKKTDFDGIIQSTGQKNNPVKLTKKELENILLQRL